MSDITETKSQNNESDGDANIGLQPVVMPHVMIDGVTYIPAKEAIANSTAIAKGLLQSYWGDCTDDQLKEFLNDPSICVLVNDEGIGDTLQSVIDNIASDA